MAISPSRGIENASCISVPTFSHQKLPKNKTNGVEMQLPHNQCPWLYGFPLPFPPSLTHIFFPHFIWTCSTKKFGTTNSWWANTTTTNSWWANGTMWCTVSKWACLQLGECFMHGTKDLVNTQFTKADSVNLKQDNCVSKLCHVRQLWESSKWSDFISSVVKCPSSMQMVSEGQIWLDNFTHCPLNIEATNQYFYCTLSQSINTEPAIPSTDLIMESL